MKITVIGMGYVGLVTAVCLAEWEHEVQGVDIDETKIEQLQSGQSPLHEPGLEERLGRFQDKLTFGSDIGRAIGSAEVVICAVGTPLKSEGRERQGVDLQAVEAVARSFGQFMEGPTLFLNKSTVPVGTQRRLRSIIESELTQRGWPLETLHTKFDIASNPEFLREGTAIQDFLNPDRVVIGITETVKGKPLSSERDTDLNEEQEERIEGTDQSEQPGFAKKTLEALYKPLTQEKGTPVLFTDPESAELIKYASNAFLATKISFINEMAQLAESLGADIETVAEGMGLDPRIAPRFLNAGVGYGGSCLPKDVKALIAAGQTHHHAMPLLTAVDAVNEAQPARLLQKLSRHVPDLKGRTIAVWGLTFKPNTDDLREAPSLKIIPALLKQGARIQAYDPVGMPAAQKRWQTAPGEADAPPQLTYADTPLEALQNADALILLTEWSEFEAISPEDITAGFSSKGLSSPSHLVAPNLKDVKDAEDKKPVVIDGRNLYDRNQMEAVGIVYESMGT